MVVRMFQEALHGWEDYIPWNQCVWHFLRILLQFCQGCSSSGAQVGCAGGAHRVVAHGAEVLLLLFPARHKGLERRGPLLRVRTWTAPRVRPGVQRSSFSAADQGVNCHRTTASYISSVSAFMDLSTGMEKY